MDNRGAAGTWPTTSTNQHKTQSTDFLVVVKRTLTGLAAPTPFDVADGKGLYTATAEAEARAREMWLCSGAQCIRECLLAGLEHH